MLLAKPKQLAKFRDKKFQTILPTSGKMVDIGSGAQKEIDDVMLTRFASYLIAQNGDPRKRTNCFLHKLILQFKPEKPNLLSKKILN